MSFLDYRPTFKVLLPFILFFWVGVVWESYSGGAATLLFYVNKVSSSFWLFTSIFIVLCLFIGMSTTKYQLVRIGLSTAFFVMSFRSILIVMSFIKNPDMLSRATVPGMVLLTTLHWLLARTSLMLPVQQFTASVKVKGKPLYD